MIETPSSYAEAPVPAARAAEPDALSEMLRAVRLTGAIFLSARLTAPFGIVSPKRYDIRMPMAHLRHISVFHLVAEGDCVIETASGARRQVEAGDLLLLPFADQHRFYKGTAPDMVFDPSLIRQGPIEGVWTVDYGGGGQETRLVCGFLELAERVHAGVPLAARNARRACRRGHGRWRARLHGAGNRSPRGGRDAGHAGDARPDDGAAVRRGVAPPCQPAADGKQGTAGGAQRPRRRPRAAASSRRPGAALDGGHPGARGGHVAHRARRKVQRPAGTPADRLPDVLAHPAGGRPAAQRQGRHRPHRRRHRLRVRGRLHPRLQARDRHDAGPLARRRRRQPDRSCRCSSSEPIPAV